MKRILAFIGIWLILGTALVLAWSAHDSLPADTHRPLITTGQPAITSTVFAYLPLIQRSESIRFAVIGDYGLASQGEQEVANLVKSWAPSFIVTTGDNNYPSGAASTIDENIGQYYHDFIFPYTGHYGAGSTINRFFPTLGNHDWIAAGATPYLNYFSLPGNERYYDLSWGPVHLFAIDSDPNEPDRVSSISAQAAWLQRKLATSSECWKLVFFHHAPFSSGPHGPSVWMQWPYPTWGADAVLSGHDHTYERIIVNGFPYFVDGLGDSSQYSFGSPVAGSQIRYNATPGAMRVTATWISILYEFIASDGTVVDSYLQSKECSGVSRVPHAVP